MVDYNQTHITDGNTYFIGLLVDNMVSLFAKVFGGLSTFGSTMGILIGVAFVLGLLLVAVGKIRIDSVTGGFK